MPTSEESTRAIGRAKAAIDNGFSRVGRTLGADDAGAAWLHSAAGRAVALCDAVILLCRENHAPEAAPLARAVLGVAADMRWLAGGAVAGRLSALKAEEDEGDWGVAWSAERLRARLTEAAMEAPQVRSLVESAGRLLAGHAVGGAAGLPWAHAFSKPPRPRLSAEEALAATARAMAEVVGALETRWPGCFVS